MPAIDLLGREMKGPAKGFIDQADPEVPVEDQEGLSNGIQDRPDMIAQPREP